MMNLQRCLSRQLLQRPVCSSARPSVIVTSIKRSLRGTQALPPNPSAAVTSTVVEQLKNPGRLFAVVHLCGRQYKVTQGDIISIKHPRPLDVGDKINIEKVLLLGGAQFTLVGRPLLPKGAARVRGIVIEKTLSNTEPDFFYVRKKSIRRLLFVRDQLTLVRIVEVDAPYSPLDDAE